MKYAQLIMGSAGTGKSTYCQALQDHCATTGRTMRVANLDPAAEVFKYKVAFDIRDLISVTDVMSELKLGPNGGLLYCMEYLSDNMEWLTDHLESFLDDDYLLIDCPGQIELYSHIPVMKHVVAALRRTGFNVCGVYLLDATFVTDAAKLISGNLMALAAMVHLELPHVNVLSKCDLIDKNVLDKYLSPSGEELAAQLSARTGERYKRLNHAVAKLLDDYDMVTFLPLDISDEDSLETLLLQLDNTLQYGEDMEPKEPAEHDEDDHDHDHGGGDDDVYERMARAGAAAAAGGGDDDDYGDAGGVGGAVGGADGGMFARGRAGDDGTYGAYARARRRADDGGGSSAMGGDGTGSA